MRVLSKLATIDFQFGRITRKDNLLVIESHPDSKMPSTVYVSPQDVVEAFKCMIVSPKAIMFVFALPYFLYRWNRSDKTIHQGVRQAKRTWPTV